MINYKGDSVHPCNIQRTSLIVANSVTMLTCADAVDLMFEDNFAPAIERNLTVSHVKG